MGETTVATIHVAGHEMRLLPSGAMLCAALSTLFVADVHLGKAATYRRLGQPVPQGTTGQTLAQLTADLRHHGVTHLVVLGDFLHGPQVHSSVSTNLAIRQWREAHRDCAITLIRGNHDDRAGDPAAELNIDVVDEPHLFNGMACCHDRQGMNVPAGVPILWGHWHPAVVLRGRARQRVRLPCFVVGLDHVLLPAYGAFTGGHIYKPDSGETLYVIADHSVFKLPGPSSVACQ